MKTTYHLTHYIYIALVLVVVMTAASCAFKGYKFNGASIDYTKTKTIQIADFPIRSSYVWGPMGPMFNNQLKDEFANHTKLIQVKRGGDLKIEGEITQYTQRNKSVAADGRSAQTELSITVNVRFTNNVNHILRRGFSATHKSARANEQGDVVRTPKPCCALSLLSDSASANA